jgi:calcineurin-like phosphoesterase family protein
MSRVFVISDLHLSHENMAIKRGFKDVLEHDEYIIKKWNSVVTKRDVVFVVGDITMESKKHYYILNKLNGIKKVIGGNHDLPKHLSELLKYVHSFCGIFKYKNLILTHCPIHESQLGRFSKNVHGHVHENTLDDDRYVNVSCEAIDYTPVLISQYLSEPKTTKKNGFYFVELLTEEVREKWILNFNHYNKNSEEFLEVFLNSYFKSNTEFIKKSFLWSDTKEGTEYWNEISKNKNKTKTKTE